MGKIILCKTHDIPSGTMKKFAVDGKDILVANLEGKYYAINDTCTHAGASLSEGTLSGRIVTCGWHGAKFDCETGGLAEFPVKIKDLNSYKLVVESDNLFIEV